MKPSASRALLICACCLLHGSFLFVLLSENEGDQKHRLTFAGLHMIISQKIELLIKTAARTSRPAKKKK
jgi:hypothetical protein